MPYYLAALTQIEVGPSAYLFLSFLNVSGHRMVHASSPLPDALALGRNQLDLREAVLPEFEGNLDRAMQSLFDQVWNAWGVPASPHFDSSGQWIGEPITTPIL